MLSKTRWSVVHAAQRGDSEALEALLGKYRQAIVDYLRRCNLGPDAEDVAQEVLLTLVDLLPKVHATAGRFRSLVFAVSHRQHLAFRKRRGALRRGAHVEHVPLEAAAIAVETEPDDLFDREWLASLLRACLERLNAEQPTLYAALQASVLAGRSQAEAARAEGVTAATMRKRVWRARKQVGAYLRELVEAYALSRDDVREELAYLSKLLGSLGPPAGDAPGE